MKSPIAFKNKLLIIIIFFAGVVYFITAYNSHGFYHVDEHFQIIEFAGVKLGTHTADDLAWEYKAEIRPAIQPAICYVIIKCCKAIGINDIYNQVFALRLLTAILALVSISLLVKSILKSRLIFSNLLYIILSFFLAFLPFINVRFSSETWSGLLFLIPVSIVFNNTKSKNSPYLIGSLLGLSFLFRYQVGFMILGFLLWLFIINKDTLSNIGKILISIFVVFILGVFIDIWFYNDFVITSWNYFKVNILEDKASGFGVSSWYFYFTEIIQKFTVVFGIFVILFTTTFIVLFYRNLITWIIVPFLLIHFIIPHKEIRFLIPIVNFLPLIIIMVADKIFYQWKLFSNIYIKYPIILIVAISLIFNMLLVSAFSVKPAGIGRMAITRYIHNHYINEPVNLIHCKWANPYKPWGGKIIFYFDENVNNIEISNICELSETLYCDSCINLIIVRSIDMELKPECNALFENSNIKIEKESYPWIVQFLGKNFSIFENKENLILYSWNQS